VDKDIFNEDAFGDFWGGNQAHHQINKPKSFIAEIEFWTLFYNTL
jgi:hypothetical protein